MARNEADDDAMLRIAKWGASLGFATVRSVAWWETKMAPRYPGAEPSINKLLEEVKELEEDPDNPYEAADVFIALTIYAYRKGWDLPAVVQSKMGVNEAREWGKPDANGTVRHVECGNLLFCVASRMAGALHHDPACPLHEVSRSSVEAAP